SSFFADIFRNNCLNIGVLPVQVSAEFLTQVFEAIEQDPFSTLKVDLQNQKIMCEAAGASERFEINSYKKNNLLNGYDDIDFLNNIKADIQKFASNTPL
ncbi:MAG: 3-isopropylmalate dehydratase, partial [Flavobacteriaceae bacterium]|nr:3-isopropylmalate dehydratase [Flavobacteriaceae bacterium]